MLIDRRIALKLMGAVGVAGGARLVGINSALAQEQDWRHGMSLFGELKYPTGFEHFDYVDPAAPKGGRARLYAIGAFDSLNPYTFKGQPAGLVTLTNDSLMTGAFDEPSTEYGLVAEAVRHPDDFSSVTFRLRADARFHDGQPMTVEDAIWSMTALKEAHPQYAFYWQNVERAEQTGDREVTFFFSVTGNRELPHIVGQLPVLPRHWWTGWPRSRAWKWCRARTIRPGRRARPWSGLSRPTAGFCPTV